MSTLIPRNKPIPNKKSQIFSTAADNQETVTIKVFEGERAMTKDNHLLGKFDLQNIPRAPRGVPQIEVTFEIDVNGVLHVSAEEKDAGEKRSITIANDQNRLSPEDIERMILEAEKMDAEDKLIKAKVEAKNDLEGYLYKMKNEIHEEGSLGAKLSSDDRTTVHNAVTEGIDWLDDNPDAETSEYLEQKRSVEEIVTPIVSTTSGRTYDEHEEGEDDQDEL